MQEDVDANVPSFCLLVASSMANISRGPVVELQAETVCPDYKGSLLFYFLRKEMN